MPFYVRNKDTFYFNKKGNGKPLVFLHGLGGNLNQVNNLFEGTENIEYISFDFRGHGQTMGRLDEEHVSMLSFAEDVFHLAEHLSLDETNIGGISLGAAISIRFALDHPEKVKKLILVRPSWLDSPNPVHLNILKEIAALIALEGVRQGKSTFKASEIYLRYKERLPNYANSLLGQFERAQADTAHGVLSAICADSPIRTMEELGDVKVPVLVIANDNDPQHPLSLARSIASGLPKAEFHIVTSRYRSPQDHNKEVLELILNFLDRA